jgi:xanthine dehydrogenase iron-sulfur cluster and FAD-binding subunit A
MNPSSIRISERIGSPLEALHVAFCARPAYHPIIRATADIATVVEVAPAADAPMNASSIQIPEGIGASLEALHITLCSRSAYHPILRATAEIATDMTVARAHNDASSVRTNEAVMMMLAA